MPLRSGMLSQWGFVVEVTPGIAVVAGMEFNPIVSDTVSEEDARIESAGIISGRRVLTSDQWDVGRQVISGDIQTELYNQNLRNLLKHMLGSESGSDPYTFTPGDLTGLSMTHQIGTPGVGGTVHPRTLAGCKVASWEIAIAEGEAATLGLSLVAMREILHRTVTDGATTNASPTVTSATAAFGVGDVGKPISGTGIPANTYVGRVNSATSVELSSTPHPHTTVNATATGSGVTFTIGLALASASYDAGIKPLHYVDASLTIGGTAVKAKKLTIAGDNALDADRRFLGQRHTDEPYEADLRAYTGTIDVEFTDLTQYRRYLHGSEAAVVATITDGTASLAITMNTRFDGSTPHVEGKGLLQQAIPFKAVASGADTTAISAVLTPA